MRLLILPDVDFLIRERTLIQRVQLGLADEGVRVLQAIPVRAAESEAASMVGGGLYAAPVRCFDTGLPWTRSLRAAAMVQAASDIARSEGQPRGSVDVVYALGEQVWPLASAVARRAGAALLMEVWRADLAPAAAALWRGVAGGRASQRPWFVAADEPLHAALVRAVPAERAVLAPWGVHRAERPSRGPFASDSLTVVLLASGRDRAAVDAALRALAEVAREIPGLMVLIDGAVADVLPVWRQAQQHGDLCSRLSIVADLEGRHDLVTQADVLLIPEALGECRSVVLQAMADGMIVIAAPDPAVGWLVPGQTAETLADGSSATIAGALRRVLAEPARADALRTAAAAWVRLHRPGSAHVRALLAACESAAASATGATAAAAT